MKKIFSTVALCLCIFGFSSVHAQETPTQVKDGVTLMPSPKAAEGEAILAEIAAAFKGQPAFIDFWATWCGPCMRAMVSIDPIKEEYMQDVAFVYVTGETSPEENFNNAIPDIKGSHYRISAAQWKALLGYLGIRGIPSYLLLDKDGKRVYDNISEGGYPGDEVVRAQLDAVRAK